MKNKAAEPGVISIELLKSKHAQKKFYPLKRILSTSITVD